MSVVRKKGLLMSLFMGTTMGLFFTLFAQVTQMKKIIPMGLVTGLIISLVISGVLGLLIPMKAIKDKISYGLFKLTSEDKVRVILTGSIASALIFSTPNSIVNMIVGKSQGMLMSGALPKEVKALPQAIGYVLKMPEFPPMLISSTLTNIVIGYLLTITIGSLYDKLTDKMVGL